MVPPPGGRPASRGCACSVSGVTIDGLDWHHARVPGRDVAAVDLAATIGWLRSQSATGAVFVAVKAVEGATWVDPCFTAMWRRLTTEGLLDFGRDVLVAYGFATGKTAADGEAQARHLVATVEAANGGPLGPGRGYAVDLEAHPAAGLADVNADCGYAYCAAVEALAKAPLVYTARWYWARPGRRGGLDGDMRFGRWPLWEADPPPATPAGAAWPHEGVVTQVGYCDPPGGLATPIDANTVADWAALRAHVGGSPQEDDMSALTPEQWRELYEAVTGKAADGSRQTDDCIAWSVRYLRQELLGNEQAGKVHPYPEVEAIIARALAAYFGQPGGEDLAPEAIDAEWGIDVLDDIKAVVDRLAAALLPPDAP